MNEEVQYSTAGTLNGVARTFDSIKHGIKIQFQSYI